MMNLFNTEVDFVIYCGCPFSSIVWDLQPAMLLRIVALGMLFRRNSRIVSSEQLF